MVIVPFSHLLSRGRLKMSSLLGGLIKMAKFTDKGELGLGKE
jgi:hypothetical protein